MPHPHSPDIPEHIIQDAALWYANLLSPQASPQLQAQWQVWLGADPQHRQAWERIEQVCLRFQAVPANIALPALSLPQPKRRIILRSLLGVSLGAGLSAAGYRYLPWEQWQADYATGVGDYAQYALSDGSQLHLHSSSALDAQINTWQRVLILRQGEILIQTGATTSSTPPLLIRTRHGQVQTQSARFILQLHEHFTQVKVLDQQVQACSQATPDTQIVVQAGQMMRFDSHSTYAVEDLPAGADAWLQGNLRALDLPLQALLNELARHHRGYLGCDPDIASLKVSGVFPLHDLAQSLAVLREAFNLQQSGLGLYWVRLHSAST